MLAMVATSCTSADDTAMRAHEISLAIAQSGGVAAWHGGERGTSRIYVQALSDEGHLMGRATPVSDGPGMAYEPDIVPMPNGYAVVWYTADERSGLSSAWLAGLNRQGRKQWQIRLGDEQNIARNPVVRFMAGRLYTAWIEQAPGQNRHAAARVIYQKFNPDGTPAGKPLIAGQASSSTWNVNAGTYKNRFILTYDAQIDTKAPELQMVVISDGSATQHRVSADDGFASLYPDMQINRHGEAALTWFDERDGNQEVYFALAPFEHFMSGLPEAKRVTYSKGPTIGAYAAWNGSRLGLAWVDSVAGRSDLYAQVFAADGAALGPAKAITSPGGKEHTGNAGVPAIRALDDGFLIGWNGYRLRGDAGHKDVISSHAYFAFVPLNP